MQHPSAFVFSLLTILPCNVDGWSLAPSKPSCLSFHGRQEKTVLSSMPEKSSSWVPGFDDDDDDADVVDYANQESMQDKKDREHLETVFKLKKPYSAKDMASSEGDSEHHIPKGGVSLSDIMIDSEVDQFNTTVVPVRFLPGVAQIVTKSINYGAFDPIRYLVALTPPKEIRMNDDDDDDDNYDYDDEYDPVISRSATQYVIVDVPPYSEDLVSQLRQFMANSESEIVAMITTSRDAIHYDEAVAMYTARQSYLVQWTKAFPKMEVVMYRLDTPRDCQELVTQRLDGSGPWAFNDEDTKFVETGRPLREALWDDELFNRITTTGEKPPRKEWGDDELYTPEAIRQREEGKRLLAVYTPGHTYGSMSYVFPETGVLVCGSTIPIESFSEENRDFVDQVGPNLDFRGYIATSHDMPLQMNSARELVETYNDRFEAVLSSKHDPLFLPTEGRSKLLLDIIDHYDEIGRIYERLGITGDDEDEDEDEDKGEYKP